MIKKGERKTGKSGEIVDHIQTADLNVVAAVILAIMLFVAVVY